MHISPDQVYVLCTADGAIDAAAAEAPFDVYHDLALDALGALDLSDTGPGTVLLKPNATVLYPPEQRIITHPGYLAGLIDALRDRGISPGRLVVADGGSGERPDRGFTWRAAGYGAMADARGVLLTELNDGDDRCVDVDDGVVYDAFGIHRRVTDCDLLLNVPLAKCHNLGCTTLSIKNLMGVVTRPQRHLCSVQEIDRPFGDDLWRLTDSGLSLFEERFNHKLCDLLTAVRSLDTVRLSAVDGVVGRDGTAFNEGTNHALGWTAVGQNEVHVDAVATYLMGLDPGTTPYLQLATTRGLGANHVEDIEVVDLAAGRRMTPTDLDRLRSPKALMPISRFSDGYYDRFRADGSVVPWRIDDVNAQRKADGLPAISRY